MFSMPFCPYLCSYVEGPNLLMLGYNTRGRQTLLWEQRKIKNCINFLFCCPEWRAVRDAPFSPSNLFLSYIKLCFRKGTF